MAEKHELQRAITSQPSGILRIAVWFGLITGFGEVFLVAIRKFYLHRVINMSLHFFWMIPLVDMILFLAIGLFLFVFARKWPNLVFRIATFAFAFTSFMSLHFVRPKLHIYAAILLALGIAVQVTRLTTSYSRIFHDLTRKTSPWMFALLLLIALGLFLVSP